MSRGIWYSVLDVSRTLDHRLALRCLSRRVHVPHSDSPLLCPALCTIGFRWAVIPRMKIFDSQVRGMYHVVVVRSDEGMVVNEQNRGSVFLS